MGYRSKIQSFHQRSIKMGKKILTYYRLKKKQKQMINAEKYIFYILIGLIK